MSSGAPVGHRLAQPWRGLLGKPSVVLVVIAAALIVLLVVAGASGAIRIGPASTNSSESAASSESLLNLPEFPASQCNYTVSLNGETPIARSSSGAERQATGTDAGAFINSLLGSEETLCISAGYYEVSTQIQLDDLRGVTLDLDPGAVMQATSGNRLLIVIASPRTVVTGGDWIGSVRSRVSDITLQYGSNDSVVQGTTVSDAGANGILVYDNVRPDYNDSILDNYVQGNNRFGIQVFSNASAGITGTLVSRNVAVDNKVGGIYTNDVSGVRIVDNVVRNSVGNGPGEIGIGVTNGYNDTVTQNQVEHMMWYGIQAYYNNYTLISDNISTFNAGGEDQSGITNDHSSFDTIVDNVVESNGRYGVYVERSWNVTIAGNIANYNLAYGIELYHGSIPEMGDMEITGNACSFNGLGGIILNSAVDDLISTNECFNNTGDGILLYNDPGQVGSTGNTVTGNWLGNEGGSPQTQTFGVAEANQSGNNTIASNVFVNDTVAATSLVGQG